MKKSTLLLLALIISITTFGQNTRIALNPNLPRVPANIANIGVLYQPASLTGSAHTTASNSQNTTGNNVARTRSGNGRSTPSYMSTQIGITYYDLQTNGSICNRLIQNSDGSISATWTFDPTSDDAKSNNASLRGTGYNYFDGSAWQEPVNTIARIETERTGWPQIVDPANGSELFVSHNTVIGGLQLTSRSTKGTGNWTENTTILKGPTVAGNWWPRMVSAGDTIHEISITYPGGHDTTYDGQSGAILYSRSNDAGNTWTTMDTLPGIDSSAYSGFAGDEYAIDVKGDTVAVVTGGLTNDVVLLKSIDGGNTWTKTVVFPFPISHYVYGAVTDTGNGHGDTLETNDGSLAVLLDNSGAAHIWFGFMRVSNDGTAKNGIYIYPGTNGLVYWNENNTDSLKIMAEAYDNLANVASVIQGGGGSFPYGRFNQGWCSWPSAAIDDSGHIFVSYSALDGNAIDQNGLFERHIYLIGSKDGGHTWGIGNSTIGTDVQDGDADSSIAEGLYASTARRITNNNVSLIYQKDFYAGVSTNTSDPNYTFNLGEENYIMFVQQPTNALLYNVPAGIAPVAKNNIGVSVYPNPSDGNLNISFKNYTGQASVIVTNILGSTVKQYNNVNVTSNNLALDLSDLVSGIYFVNVETAQGSAIQKIVIAGNN